MRRDVVITGMGCVSCAGIGLAETQRSIAAGTCCLSPINDPRMSHLKARYAGLVGNLETRCAGFRPEWRRFDRHVQLALLAAEEALAEAVIRPAEWGRRLGLVFSTCSGPMLLIEEHYERILLGSPQINQDELFAKRYYSGATILSCALGVRGATMTVVTACTAGTAAIALGADLIRCGMLDAVLAGGADAFATSTLAGFDGLKATCEGKCAPFSRPYGLNLGEAASFVFLENFESARVRAPRIRGLVAGSGTSNDAYHCSSPEPTGRGLASAMQRALDDAGVAPDQISYVNAHGTGTEANDRAEARALRRVFGQRTKEIPVSSTKSMVGHCLGAAGALETVATILCAEIGVLPPTANFTQPREGCALDAVSSPGRTWCTPRTFLTNNLAFGGHNASLVIRGPDQSKHPFLASETEAPSILAAPQAASDKRERIYITGCGIVSAAGIGRATLINAMGTGSTQLQATRGTNVGPAGARLIDAQAIAGYDRRLDLREMDASSRWTTVATRLALKEAAFPDRSSTLSELGLFLNLSAGPSRAESEFLTSFLAHQRQVSQLVEFPFIVPSSVAGNVCRALRLTGHNLTLSLGPGAGLLGLGPALAALRSGHTEALLVGAVDELSNRILADNFAAGLYPEDGPPPGEGAVVLMLETEGHAQRRGAKPLAAIRGLALSAPAPEPETSGPHPGLLSDLVREALTQAGAAPDQIVAVCLCGDRQGLRQALDSIHPALGERTVDGSDYTGSLEGAQPLVDFAVALGGLSPVLGDRPFILSLSSSWQSGNATAVFECPASPPTNGGAGASRL